MDTAKTFLIDKAAIRQKIILDPEFSALLIMWHQKGRPDMWHSIETEGGQFDHPFFLSEYELDQLGVGYLPSEKTYWASMYYFSDLVKSFFS